MAKKILESTKVAAPGGIMSQGVEVLPGKMVFVSGQVARAVSYTHLTLPTILLV